MLLEKRIGRTYHAFPPAAYVVVPFYAKKNLDHNPAREGLSEKGACRFATGENGRRRTPGFQRDPHFRGSALASIHPDGQDRMQWLRQQRICDPAGGMVIENEYYEYVKDADVLFRILDYIKM